MPATTASIPIQCCTMKFLATARYVVEIHDSVFRGREDFVYRMALGELPFVTSIFPLGGKAGQEARVTVQGWNLPSDSLNVDSPSKSAGIEQLDKEHRSWPLNRVPFAWDSLPECFEQEPNDAPEEAQRVTLPIIVNGRIDHPGDRDVSVSRARRGRRSWPRFTREGSIHRWIRSSS